MKTAPMGGMMFDHLNEARWWDIGLQLDIFEGTHYDKLRRNDEY
jgi:hypothetical protein